MSLHDRYGLTNVINAAGSFTPVGVSRSSAAVARATAAALGEFFVIDELQDAVGAALARWTGAEAGAATHCAAAGITAAVAASMTGLSPEAVAALPDTTGMANRVVLPAGHAVNYGHPIVQDIRLAGARPAFAGSEAACSVDDIEAALAPDDTACLLLVSSRLTRGAAIDLTAAVAAAHRRGVPAFIDGAAQDLRIPELLATGAELVLVSAHKYLASPTAGLVVGDRRWVQAVRAQEKGIARAMKPTKEAMCGVLAAIEEREQLDMAAWRQAQDDKVARFVRRANAIAGLTAQVQADPSGMPFPRAYLRTGEDGPDARALFDGLRSATPSIWVMEHGVADGELILELVQVRDDEIETILAQIARLMR
jgi:L-seryl-tRNA(Ser) seleniumtransferase